MRNEYRQLEELRQREQEEQERIKKIAEERKMEIEKARIKLLFFVFVGEAPSFLKEMFSEVMQFVY